MISFCDAVFLTPEAIRNTVKTIEQSQADIVLHYVQKQTYEQAGLPAKRTYIPIEDKLLTGTTIYYVRKFSKVIKALDTLSEMRRSRKDPQGILSILGCEENSLSAIEQALSKKLDCKVRIFLSEHPGMGMDVDKPADYELAVKVLQSPWQHTYQRCLIILNPEAGQGKPLPTFVQNLTGLKQPSLPNQQDKLAYINQAIQYLNQYGIKADLQITEYKGHATELANDAIKQNYQLVIAAGGDGTVQEVINGIVDSELVLGVLPIGTANVFSLEMQLPQNLKAACQVIGIGAAKAH